MLRLCDFFTQTFLSLRFQILSNENDQENLTPWQGLGCHLHKHVLWALGNLTTVSDKLLRPLTPSLANREGGLKQAPS